MRRIAVLTAGVALVASATGLPLAGADAGGQVVRVNNGAVRCLLQTADPSHNRLRAVCGRTDGAPFGASPMSVGKFPEKLDLVVALDTGEMYWEAGTIPGSPSADVVLSPGQTYRYGDWTVAAEDLRTIVRHVVSGHGLDVNPAVVRAL